MHYACFPMVEILLIRSRVWCSSAFLQGTIVSAALAGGGIGSIVGGILADGIGRHATMIVTDAVFAVGACLMGFAPHVSLLILGRFVVGFGVGSSCVVVPVFIAERAPPQVRAQYVTMNILSVTFGQVSAYVSNYVFSFVPGTWRWMLGIAALPSLAQAILLTCWEGQSASNDQKTDYSMKKSVKKLIGQIKVLRSPPLPAELYVGECWSATWSIFSSSFCGNPHHSYISAFLWLLHRVNILSIFGCRYRYSGFATNCWN